MLCRLPLEISEIQLSVKKSKNQTKKKPYNNILVTTMSRHGRSQSAMPSTGKKKEKRTKKKKSAEAGDKILVSLRGRYV